MPLFPYMKVPVSIYGRNMFNLGILCYISPVPFISQDIFTYMSSQNISEIYGIYTDTMSWRCMKCNRLASQNRSSKCQHLAISNRFWRSSEGAISLCARYRGSRPAVCVEDSCVPIGSRCYNLFRREPLSTDAVSTETSKQRARPAGFRAPDARPSQSGFAFTASSFRTLPYPSVLIRSVLV